MKTRFRSLSVLALVLLSVAGAHAQTRTTPIKNTRLQGDLAATADLSPAQLTADANDYSPSGLDAAIVLRLSTDASRTITGLAGGSAGRLVFVHNVGSNPLVLADEDAGSTAANRFALSAAVTLSPDVVALLQYDATTARWRVVASGSGGAGGVADGDKTDITVSGSGATWTIDNGTITLAKHANVATDRLLGRDTAGSGAPEELTVGGGLEFSGSGGIQRSALTGDATASAGSNATTVVQASTSFALPGNISPTQLTADVNDYSPTGLSTATVLRLSSDAARNITGLAGGASGRVLKLLNIGTNPIVLVSESSSSTAANRFTGGDVSLPGGGGIEVVYDATSSRWRVPAAATIDNTTMTVNASGQLQRAALTGDVTASAGSNALTVANNAITYGKMQDVAATQRVLGRNTAGAGDPEEVTLSQLLDWASATQGAILYRNASGWVALAPGTAGQVLESGGAGANPAWGTDDSGGGGVSDGDKGDVTIASSGTVFTVDSAAGAFAFLGDISPAELTASVNDYSPTGLSTAAVLRLSSDASRNITGLAGGADGRVLTLLNIGSNAIVLVSESGSSTAANRFTGGDVTLPAGGGATLVYDSTSSRWRLPGGGTVDNASLTFSGSGQLQRAALTGDATASAGSNALAIANDAVTNAKAANVATNTIKGRVTAATGDPEDLTPANALTVLESGGTNILLATEVDTFSEADALMQFPVELCIAASDETTAITTGTAKATFRAPYAFTVTAVRLGLTTVSSSGLPTIDINEGGTTILSTKLTCDASEKTSTTAATPAVISDSAIADDAEITIDFDVAGTGATGVKVWILGYR